jgi:hypothetical protein
MTKYESNNLLSIHINRQRIGLAVFGHGELDLVTGHAVPSGLLSRTAFMRELKQLLVRNAIGIVLIKKLTVQQRASPSVVRLHKRIQKLVISRGLTLTVRDRRFEKIENRDETIEALLAPYPELGKYLRGGTSWERRYYGHLTKAVRSGLTWLAENTNSNLHDE